MFFIGIKYFWSSMQRGRLKNVLRLTIVSLSINIGVFIVGLALIRGFQHETLAKTLRVYGHAQITPYAEPDALKIEPARQDYYIFDAFPALRDWIKSAKTFLSISDNPPAKFERIVEKYEMQGAVSRTKKTDGVMINGISDDDAKYVIGQNMKEGSVTFKDPAGREGVIVGHRLAKRFGVSVGGKLDLLLKSGAEMDTIPSTVMGIFDFGFYEFDSSLVIVSKDLLSEYKPYSVGTIYVKNPEQIDEYIKNVMLVEPDLDIQSWRERNRMVDDMFKAQIRAISIIMGFFILSAIIQSISSLFVLLSERSYDLSVLTMLGMSPRQKYEIFAAYGLLISISNTLFGILSGIGLCLLYPHFRTAFETATGQKIIHSEAFWLSDFDPRLVLTDIAGVALATLVVMSFAMLIAAHFSSKIDVMQGVKD